MKKAGKTIPSLSLFLHFAVVFIHIFFEFEVFFYCYYCVQAYTTRQESHVIVFQIWNSFNL